jgi:hypothetical protein
MKMGDYLPSNGSNAMKNLICCLVILLLTSCHSVLLTNLIASSGDVLYFDNFSDPSSGWRQASDISGKMDYEQDQYNISISIPHYDLWAVSNEEYKDVRVEVDATPLMGTESIRFGLICRYENKDNFYFFVITGDGYYTIGKVADGIPTLMGQEMMSYSPAVIKWNTQNHLRFDCSGSTLTGYANSQSVASVDDTDFSKGDAGLIAGSFEQADVDVVFDNFVVYKP